MKITDLLNEAPIEPTDDPNDPVVYGHEKANPMSLKGRIMQARAQLKDLAERAESNDLLVWQGIVRDAKGGLFMGLEQNLEQIRHGIEELATRRKKGGVGSRGIDKNIGEHIVKVKGGYELKSKHGNKNLGKYPTKAGAEKRERQVQYFKHAGSKHISEFAPSDNSDGEEDSLRRYARMWYTGSPRVQEQVEKILARMGWEIGEIESEEGGAFIVQSGDEHGNSYIGFAPDELSEGMISEKWSQKYKRSINCSNPKGFSQRAHCQGRKK